LRTGGCSCVATYPDATPKQDAAADAGSPCLPPNVVCGTSCVALQTDPGNCGSCNHACKGACQAGVCTTPVTLSDATDHAICLALDATSVYWANYDGTGSIRRVAKSGGQPVTLYSAQNTYPWSMAVDAQNIYWTVPNPYWTNGNTAVMEWPLAGGAATTLASNVANPYDIAVSPTNVYWTTEDSPVALLTVPIDGGSVTPLATVTGGAGAIAIDANHVYWSTYGGTYMEALAGGSPQARGPQAAGIAVDATGVYYTVNVPNANPWLGNIVRTPIGGGPQTVVASQRPGSVIAIAVDDTNVYWTEGEGTIQMGAVAKVAKSGGTPVLLATGLGDPTAIAVDDTSVYFISGAAIEKVAK
jgi:hypothetical protein